MSPLSASAANRWALGNIAQRSESGDPFFFYVPMLDRVDAVQL